MDVTRKIPKEDIQLLNELQNSLSKRDIKTSQKDLIDKAIKFSLKYNKDSFILMIKDKGMKEKISEKKLFDKWLKSDVKIKGDIIKEHDTTI